ncbi:MAG TPA: electron transport complex subunit RsxC [Steroidobacteraceae bacterium]|jgi:electron transport complex protein RnfC
MSAGIAVFGGLRLDTHKRSSTLRALRQAAPPAEVVLPLDQHSDGVTAATVKPGDTVLLGQPIAQPQSDTGAWLHATVSGRVTAVEPRPAPHRQGRPTLCIVIANDGADRHDPANSPVDYRTLEPMQLCEHIGRGGVVGLGGAMFPTATKLLQAQATTGVHLLLNGAECEPWISCDEMLMRERAQDVVLGARILCHALQTARCTVAIENDMPDAHSALTAAIAAAGAEEPKVAIELAVVPRVYPAGGERQLITTLTDLEVPHDGLPSDVGMVCQNVGTAAAVARWIRDGEPLISRIVTVTGSGVREPANLEVRLGTPMSHVIAECGGYLEGVTQRIMGGSMMGVALPQDSLPIIKGTNCVIAATAEDLHPRGAEMPCIRCGNCSFVCPALLLPQQLHWHAQAGDLPALERYGLMDCIECGCCDYVCPSQIPLAQRFRDAKPALAANIASRQQASLSKARFEGRQDRLDRLEAERRAKLEEKRKAVKK